MRVRSFVFVSLALILGLFAVACQPVPGAGKAGPVVNTEERKERILANLKEEFPQLGQLQVSLGDVERDEATGMDVIKMTVNGPRGPDTQTLLVSPNDKALYLTMAGPLDVSRSTEEIAKANAKKSAERATTLAKLAENQPFRGSKDAPVAIYEFSDFQCPFCLRGHKTMEQVLEKYPNDVKVYFMHYPLNFHPWAKPAAVAAECAGNQNNDAFWALHASYFANQSELSLENVLDKSEEYLSSHDIDKDKWSACAKDQSTAEHQEASKKVDTMMQVGGDLGVTGTPAYFLNGELVTGAVPFEEIEAKIKEALSQQG